MNHSSIYLDNDHVVVVQSLTDQDGVAVTDATVTVESIVDNRGTAVTGVSFPISLSHESAGTYEGSLPKEIQIREGRIYKAHIRAVADGKQAQWTESLVAKTRAA